MFPTLTPPDASSDDLIHVLERYWGYTSFRPLQRQAMDAILSRRDSVVVLPTGGGKSLCFQAPALVRQGLGVVVSPLISLMKDQVDTLVGNGVSAALYNSTLSSDEKTSVSAGLREGPLPVALRVAGAARGRGQRWVSGPALEVRRAVRCGGRGALHQPVGARLPPGVPAARPAAQLLSGRQPPCLHGDRDGARAPRHRGAARAPGPDRARRLLRSAEPHLPRARAREPEAADPRRHGQAAAARPGSSTAPRGGKSMRSRRG